MRNRAVLISGSPGAGKSTLSAYLARQLMLHGIPTRLIHEHDFARVDEVAELRKNWYFGDPNTMASWLAATPVFFGPCLASGAVWVLDALYPGFFWLLGQYTPEDVAGFAAELAALLRPVSPLVVYLAGEPRAFIERAVARRGTGWRDSYVTYASGWHLDAYPGGPIQDIEDVIRLFEWRDRHILEILARWPVETLILDAVHTPLPELEHALLDHVGLREIAEEALPEEVLRGYTGEYASDDPDAPGPLIIELTDGRLSINAYWDDGCPLVPEGPDTFRLEATEQAVNFIIRPDGAIEGLRYVHDGSEDVYRKVRREDPHPTC